MCSNGVPSVKPIDCEITIWGLEIKHVTSKRVNSLRDDIIKLYLSGLSQRGVSNTIGIDQKAIGKILRHAGISRSITNGIRNSYARGDRVTSHFREDVTAAMDGFNKKRIRVKVGQPVTIRLTSLDNEHHTDGGGKHQWAVDELNLNVIAPPLGSNYVTFTPAKAGTYTFYCDICCGGRANPTMSGRLIVDA